MIRPPEIIDALLALLLLSEIALDRLQAVAGMLAEDVGAPLDEDDALG